MMRRLIDADKLKDYLLDLESNANNDKTKSVVNDMLHKAFIKFIDEQPTAYDVDAVIVQIKERTAFLSDCTKYGNATKERREKSYDNMMMYEVAGLIDDLIEIVKAGGVNGNT